MRAFGTTENGAWWSDGSGRRSSRPSKAFPLIDCCAINRRATDSFDFNAIPSLNRLTALALTRCEWIDRKENVIALSPSDTGKTHVALGLGLAACQKGFPVSFITGSSLVHKLMEARDEKRLMRLKCQLAKVKLLIIPLGRLLRNRLSGSGRVGICPPE